ncbi:MAG: hypothetical protein ACRD3W_15075 [Terriglobales bacterium]
MAVLKSEDQESLSALELIGGPLRQVTDQTWQRFSLILTSGTTKLSLGVANSTPDEDDACILCRKPDDEITRFIKLVQELVDFDRDKLLFEPAEPSFELMIERSNITGLRVSAWLDAGNAKTGIYRWDAAGIRFFTLQEHLVTFLHELKSEFA